MNPRIVICRSNAISPDPRVEKIGRALNGAGWSVQAVGWDRTGSLPQQDRAAGFPVRRLVIRAAGHSGLGNIPQLLRWQWGLLAWLVQNRQDYTLIHACDFDTVLPALVCKWLWHKAVIYDIFDFFADMLRLTPGPLVRLVRAAELWAIGRADAVILADDARREQIRGAHPRRTAVVYNSPEDQGRPEDQELPQPGPLRSSSPVLRLAYVGNLQVERGLLVLLDVLARHPDWTLDLAGSGPDEALILARALGMPQVTWHGQVPYRRALELNRGADVLLATYDPSIPNHRYSSANKLYEAMLLGKPIIVARSTNMDRVVEKEGCGLVVTYGAADELEAALLHLQAQPGLRQRLGEQGRQAYQSVYGWSRQQARLLELYDDVAAACGSG